MRNWEEVKQPTFMFTQGSKVFRLQVTVLVDYTISNLLAGFTQESARRFVPAGIVGGREADQEAASRLCSS